MGHGQRARTGSVIASAYVVLVTDRDRPPWVAMSSPAFNRPLVPRVERLAKTIRRAAKAAEGVVDLPFEQLYGPCRPGLGFTLTPESSAPRSAWALIGEWLVGYVVQAHMGEATLAEAHAWFWSGRDVGHTRVPDVDVQLGAESASEVRALLPYLLDPMESATRRDILAAKSTPARRTARKKAGVYYTPGDVAYLMVQRTLAGRHGGEWWLDPAHGSGVFLRAVLCATLDDPTARERLYGIDLDPMAAEATSFVLTAEDLMHSPEGPPPWQRWHHFRQNLVTGNSLLIETSNLKSRFSMGQQAALFTEDAAGYALGPWRIEDAFPEVGGRGFDRIIANPPYAPLSRDASAFHVPRLHPVTGRFAKMDISPVFVELSSALLADSGSMAIVTPLSEVTSTRSPFPELRRHLSRQPGRLDFISFDRVPDALFGDDIKTRNAIIYLDRSAPNAVNVSPLYRWTSRTRDRALSEIPMISVSDLPGAPTSIAKIGHDWERELFKACMNYQSVVQDWIINRKHSALQQVGPSDAAAGELLAVAPTAYNYLGVTRDPYRAVTDGHNSQSGVSLLRFDNERMASAAYALLSSRLAFWLWHIMGDGFHVTSGLPGLVPAPDPDDVAVGRLADLGDLLWKEAAQSPGISKNGGRTTVSYPTWTHTELSLAIDQEVEGLLSISYTQLLTKWHESLIVVDFDSDRRNFLRNKL